jgi:hypothetical protein
MFKWITSVFTSTSQPTSDSVPAKKEEISYFYSKINDDGLVKDQKSTILKGVDQPTTTAQLTQDSTEDHSSLVERSIFYHSAILHKDTISMGVEFSLNKNISWNFRSLWSDDNNSRFDTSVRYYANPLTRNFKRPNGEFISLGYSSGCTDNIDLLVGKKVYIGEDVISCPVVVSACIGPSYFVDEHKLSTLIEMSVGIEI